VSLSHDQQQRVLGANRMIQAHYQREAFEAYGVNAPPPVAGESYHDYRRRLAVQAKRLLPEDNKYHRLQYRRQDDSVLDNFEPQLLQEVKKHAFDNASVPWDQPLRQVYETDPQNGLKVIKWVGQRSFVHDFKAVPRRVVSFLTSNGRYDAAKGRWF
jgi:hypothetical protein